MISQMNAVQNAARLAMADHRAAAPRPVRRRARRAAGIHPLALGIALAVVLLAALLIG